MLNGVKEPSSAESPRARPWTQAMLGLAIMAAGVAALRFSEDPARRARRQIFEDFRAYERLSRQVGGLGRCSDPAALVSRQTRAALRRVLEGVDLPRRFSVPQRFGYRFVFFGEGPSRGGSPARAGGEPEGFTSCVWVATPEAPYPGMQTFTYFSSRPGRAFVRSDGLRATVDDPSALLSEGPPT